MFILINIENWEVNPRPSAEELQNPNIETFYPDHLTRSDE